MDEFFLDDVEQERQPLPRYHFRKKLRVLYHRRVQGTPCTDVVYSSDPSARKLNCFQ